MAFVTAPATLSKIKSVFGGGNSLSEYRRGGGKVPNTPHYNAISATTNGLAISQFTGIEHPEPANVSLIVSGLYNIKNILKAPNMSCHVNISLPIDGTGFATGMSGVPMEYRMLSIINLWLPPKCYYYPEYISPGWKDFNGFLFESVFEGKEWFEDADRIVSETFTTIWKIEFRVKSSQVSIGTLDITLECGYE